MSEVVHFDPRRHRLAPLSADPRHVESQGDDRQLALSVIRRGGLQRLLREERRTVATVEWPKIALGGQRRW